MTDKRQHLTASEHQRIVSALRLASSQNVTDAKAAESELKFLESKLGFHRYLLEIALNSEENQYARWMGFLCLKNGIERNWRLQSSLCIPDEEKLLLKEKILQTLNEPILQLATQGCYIIGSIARQDIRSWPELIPSLMKAMKTDNETIHHRSLLSLNEVCRSLAKKRLMADRLLFRKLSEAVFSQIMEVWNYYVNKLLQLSSSNGGGSTAVFVNATLTAKVLKKLMLNGSRAYKADSHQLNYLRHIIEILDGMIFKQNVWNSSSDAFEEWYIFVVTLLKTVVESQKLHPIPFIPLLSQSLLFSGKFLTSQTGPSESYAKLTILCASLMKGILRCLMYKIPKSRKQGDSINIETIEADKIKTSILTEQTLANIFNQLLFSYLPLTQEDIELWEEDPETYMTEEPGDSCNFSVRAAVESLLLTLVYEYRSMCTPLITGLVESVNNLAADGNFTEAICNQKDTVYHIVGLVSYELFRDFDFDVWFQTYLYKELCNNNPRMNYLRQRIIWMVGRWFNVTISPDNRQIIYKVIPSLLNSNDMVLRLTAANTVKKAVEDFTFVTTEFLPYAGDILNGICQLLNDCIGYDTKISLLGILSTTIESLDYKICPFIVTIFTSLQATWHQSLDHFESLCSVVKTFNCLAKAARSQSMPLQNFLVPLLKQATDVKQPHHVYLLEDALALWSNLVKNTTDFSTDLFELSENLFPLFELASESLPLCLSITTSYLLGDTAAFLKRCGRKLAQTVKELLGKMGYNDNVRIAQLMETVASISAVHCFEVFADVLPDLVDAIVEDESFPPVLNTYLYILGMIMYADNSMFFHIIGNYCRLTSNEPNATIAKCFDVWFDKCDSMTVQDHKTTTAMCFFSLLDVNESVVVDRYGSIIDMACSILADENQIIDSGATIETSLPECNDLETEESKRLRRVRNSCRWLHVNQKQYFISKLQNARQVFGEHHFQNIMNNIDQSLLQQLASLTQGQL